jgi:hypothetical protein
MNAHEVAARFDGMKRVGRGYKALCPAHDDHNPSLSITEGTDGRVLVKCHVGCPTEQVITAKGLKMRDLFPTATNGNRKSCSSSEPHATTQPPAVSAERTRQEKVAREAATEQDPANVEAGGLTLAEYATAKRLPVSFLSSIGLRDCKYSKKSSVRIPYLDAGGLETAVRFRLRLEKGADGDDRFKWKSGTRISLYGLWRLNAACKASYVVIVEGESDCHTLWHHSIPAVGLPGAGNWREDRDAPQLADIPTIYVLIEPDAGGEVMRRWLDKSVIRDRVRLVQLGAYKDPSALHCDEPESFNERFRAALTQAVAWTDEAEKQKCAEAAAAYERCGDLARAERILDRFHADITRLVVGEEGALKLLFLALVSRHLRRPVSVLVKGPSSAGKSHITEQTLRFFPESAYFVLSGMSERLLAYIDEPLAHRHLVVYEHAGMNSDFASYLLRTLLSEGRINYMTVEKTGRGMQPRHFEVKGPTGFITTTTALNLHPENETRCLSITINDSPAQTKSVLMRIAARCDESLDYSQWHALASWLERAEHRVSIPYAVALAERIPPIATRLRRDFTTVLTLIEAHAVLHQASRARDAQGHIVAELNDYRIVRVLVAEVLADSAEASVSLTIRETVEAVRELTDGSEERPTKNAEVARKLSLDKSTALRRVRAAVAKGYVRNLEERRGREARLVCGDPLPGDVTVLPPAEALEGCAKTDERVQARNLQAVARTGETPNGCAVNSESGEVIPFAGDWMNDAPEDAEERDAGYRARSIATDNWNE